MRSPTEQILLELKTRGPQDTLALSERLGVSRQAILQTLGRLSAEDFVAYATERRGVGRPRRLWTLTDKAQARFPDTHAQLTVELLDAVRAEFGEAGVDRLIERRERATQATYLEALSAASGLEDRVASLATLRANEGYMADWVQLEAGVFLLIENHCPICAAASACQGFCRAELALFRLALGRDVDVERTDHILVGARRCAYRITARERHPVSAA